MNLLSPFGKLYGRVMDVRNRLYDRGVLKSYELGAWTISVGNLTTGGTGKTPLVALIANMLIDDGEKVCILTRGYGRMNPKSRVLVSDGSGVLVDAETGGDEPVELALKLDCKAIIVADPDRVSAAKWARAKFDITTFVLDDGFQHRRVLRDLDIVCIDATKPCGNGRILPAGTLREGFKGLKRADAIIITRADQIGDTSNLEERLRKRNAAAPIFMARTELKGFVTLENFHAKTQTSESIGDDIFAFSAIGNSKSFFRTLSNAGITVSGEKAFRDHYQFTQDNIREIEGMAKEKGAGSLVTTAKDAVKLKGLKFELPCCVALAETVIDDIDAFKNLVISSS